MPTAYDPLKVKRLLDKTKDTPKFFYDFKRAGNPPLALKPGDEVRMQLYSGNSKWSPGVVVKPYSAPRYYVVKCGDKQYRRNSQHLRRSTAAANSPCHHMCDEQWTDPPSLPKKESHPSCPPELPLSPPKAPVGPTQAQPQRTTRLGRVVKPPDRLTL